MAIPDELYEIIDEIIEELDSRDEDNGVGQTPNNTHIIIDETRIEIIKNNCPNRAVVSFNCGRGFEEWATVPFEESMVLKREWPNENAPDIEKSVVLYTDIDSTAVMNISSEFMRRVSRKPLYIVKHRDLYWIRHNCEPSYVLLNNSVEVKPSVLTPVHPGVSIVIGDVLKIVIRNTN